MGFKGVTRKRLSKFSRRCDTIIMPTPKKLEVMMLNANKPGTKKSMYLIDMGVGFIVVATGLLRL